MPERMTYIPPEAIGQTEEGVRDSLNELSQKTLPHFTPEFVGNKTQELSVPLQLREIRLAQRSFQEARISQAEGKVVINTEHPVSIFFIGDVHFGSMFTDHQRFMRDIEMIKEHPGTYVVFMANLIDNGIPAQYPDSMLANALKPDKQVVAMRQIVEDLNAHDKVLAAITSPCHEGWTYKKAGQDVNALMFGFPDRKFPVLENGGRLACNINGARYNLHMYHMVGPFESNFNETHALRQMNRLNLLMSADVVVGAHKHFSTAQMVYEGVSKRRKPVAYLRTGTYKGIGRIHDQWAVGRYGAGGEPSGQSVMLWPHRKRMAAFLDIQTGMDAHDAFYLKSIIDEKKREEAA